MSQQGLLVVVQGEERWAGAGLGRWGAVSLAGERGAGRTWRCRGRGGRICGPGGRRGSCGARAKDAAGGLGW